MKSIIQKHSKHCFVCQQDGYTEEHHIFFGANRKLSEKYGLKVYLCYEHHRGANGVHGKNGRQLNLRLKQTAQKNFEESHTKKEFIQIFGKNYI